MTQRKTAPAVDIAVGILAKRLDELQALDKLEPDERTEVRLLTALLSDVEAKQEAAANQRANIMLQALVGRRNLENLPVHERALAIRAITGEEQEGLRPLTGSTDDDE